MNELSKAVEGSEFERRRLAARRLERVPARRGRRRHPLPVLIAHLDPASIAAEAYRTLRANLEFMRTDPPCRNVAVTSPTEGAGKSTTAANLAIVAAQSGWRVCLVDADFRRPVLHEVFGLPNTGGLATVLENGVPLHSVARDTTFENLTLIVSGRDGPGFPQDLFTSQRLQKVMGEASNHFDLVLYDTPPVISVADAVNVAALCDGVIMVVRSGSVSSNVLQHAVRQITQVNGRILGVLLNQVDLRRGDDDVYRYYRAYYNKNSKR